LSFASICILSQRVSNRQLCNTQSALRTLKREPALAFPTSLPCSAAHCSLPCQSKPVFHLSVPSPLLLSLLSPVSVLPRFPAC
jgi:hypothetical protein